MIFLFPLLFFFLIFQLHINELFFYYYIATDVVYNIYFQKVTTDC